MTDQTFALSTIYKGWESYQRRLVRMIAPLSAEHLMVPVGAHHWTVGMVVQHLLGDRVWWFHLWMGEGSADLAPIIAWNPAEEQHGPPINNAAELVTALESTWQMIATALTRWTPSDLEHVFSPPSSLSEAEQQAFGDTPRDWILWHVLEHEIHHGGELSVALGAQGLPGIYGRA